MRCPGAAAFEGGEAVEGALSAAGKFPSYVASEAILTSFSTPPAEVTRFF